MTYPCDYHVHIGQWYDTYYDSHAVFSALKECGTEECWFSSTSSERYCAESIAVQGNADLQKSLPSARKLYEEIKEEVAEALRSASEIGMKAHALYWVIPEVHFSGAASVAEAMASLPYEGFKLHPRGNFWDLSDEKTRQLAEEVFSYAEKHGLLILIHCGEDDFERPTKFEPFIVRHSCATVQLAHTRPLEDTLYMLRSHPSTLCDTAFTPKEVQEKVRCAGFGERMRAGSDFPITHWYECGPKRNPTARELIEFLQKGE